MKIFANNLLTERRVRRAARSIGLVLVANPNAEGYMIVNTESGTVLDGLGFTLTLTGVGNVVESLIEQEDILDEGDAEDFDHDADALLAAD
jgi:hypothetical protein